MEFEDCIKFANETPVCYLATVDGDQPRVRALGFWFADETGFYFQIGDIKDMYGQMQANPKVEACFWQPDEHTGTMMRVAGEVEFVDDISLKKKVLEDRPFLKEFGMTFDSPGLIIFKIPKGQAYFWTMATNFQPKEMINFGD
ncbi:pyridoxamine 5'-phosphate oxidase family protein [Methanobacterium alcaliphilum]|uniref:pyridoxamine 5'-phosphate oxidase family protein n=1 Tax=Methanobacterium alcaliphilum TaxID=392018 RepID=UPI002009FFDB|nr:pyridoxamine 5'-phosphate oxidase family protein [Methanobacterium alcaliphilum]MCK9151980.1 pyridoxamine 5'-phosphate oxidase family protein [Methanobacterium alcaliphilum]